MIMRSLIAFEDFLGSSIAPQVMPPWLHEGMSYGRDVFSRLDSLCRIGQSLLNCPRNLRGCQIILKICCCQPRICAVLLSTEIRKDDLHPSRRTFLFSSRRLDYRVKMEAGGGTQPVRRHSTEPLMDTLDVSVADFKLILRRLGDLDDPYFKSLVEVNKFLWKMLRRYDFVLDDYFQGASTDQSNDDQQEDSGSEVTLLYVEYMRWNQGPWWFVVEISRLVVVCLPM